MAKSRCGFNCQPCVSLTLTGWDEVRNRMTTGLPKLSERRTNRVFEPGRRWTEREERGLHILGSIAQFMGKLAMEKAAAWKSPKSGLFHYAWKSRKSSGISHFSHSSGGRFGRSNPKTK